MLESVTQERLSFGSEPLALVGDPRHCMGLLQMHNPNAGAVRLRRLRLRSSAPELTSGCQGGVVEVQLSAALCPGDTRQVRVTLRLPPGTPPGCYEACLDGADGVSLPVSIHVLESRIMRLWPPAVAYGAQAGETFTVRTSASNQGNVPLLIPSRAAVELHASDRGWPEHFHAVAKSHGDKGYGVFLDAFVKRLSDEEPALGRAKVKSGAGLLAPQQSRLLELAVSMPKKLHGGRRYSAIVRLADARFRMSLHVAATDETTSVPE